MSKNSNGTFTWLLKKCRVHNRNQSRNAGSELDENVEQCIKFEPTEQHEHINEPPKDRTFIALKDRKAALKKRDVQAKKQTKQTLKTGYSRSSELGACNIPEQHSKIKVAVSNPSSQSIGNSTNPPDSSAHNSLPNADNDHLDDGAARLLTDHATSGGADIRASAFRQAVSVRCSSEQQTLKDAATFNFLLTELQVANSEREKNRSKFWKGMELLKPLVRGLDVFIDATGPAVTIEPHVAGAYTIAKTVSLLAITVCGAAEEFKEAIESFLTHVPLIDRCDQILGWTPNPSVPEVLVKTYGDVLDFYFECVRLLGSEHPNTRIAFTAKYRLSEIASSFVKNTELLSKHVGVETYAIVQKQDGQRANDLIRQLLGSQFSKQNTVQEELVDRDNEACEWINSDPLFREWLHTSSGTYWISMYGKMGCGKSTTTSYVAKVVRETLQSTTAVILPHFCRDDNETCDLQKIYVSLLHELIRQVERLKWAFQDWHDKAKNVYSGSTEPTQSSMQLGNLLETLVGSVKQPIFIIIDGLDECSAECRMDLLALLKRLRAIQERVRVFISCRPDQDIKRMMPENTKTIQFSTTKHRDRLIAEYLISRKIPRPLTADAQEFVITEMAERADGSAIWMRLLLEYLASTGSTKLAMVQRDLQNTSPKRLSDLYVKLFERATSREPTNERVLAQILEILAGSLRPLSLEELSFAVAMAENSAARFTKLEELEGFVDEDRILVLARPFISNSMGERTKDVSVHLVHQSLKELILVESPQQWTSHISGRPNSGISRRAALNGDMLRRCLDYLLLEEFDNLELLPQAEAHVDEMNALAYMFMDNNCDDTPVVEQQFSYDPRERGFGGFFEYSACHWLSHLKEASADEYLPTLMDLEILCCAQVRRLNNWVEQYKRPSCSYAEYDLSKSHIDPIALVACFGSSAALDYVLRQTKDGDQWAKHFQISGWPTLEYLLGAGNIQNLKIILTHATTRSSLRDPSIFWTITTHWRHQRQYATFDDELWLDLFHFLISEMIPELEDNGNEVLCRVAQDGCLPLVKLLFAAATHNEKIHDTMLKAYVRKSGTWDHHQSVGAAASWGHTETVEWLCQQNRIDGHLRYRNSKGENAIHAAARQGHADTLRVLIKYFPEGVNQMSDSGTPLAHLVFDAGSEDRTAAAEILLKLGAADPQLTTDDDPYFAPLRVAARNANAIMCRVLIVAGSSSPWELITVSFLGVPTLRYPSTCPGDSSQLLQEICALVPISVLTGYVQ